MKTNLKYIIGIFFALLISSCSKEDYNLGDLTAPSNIVIETEILGQSVANPNGDGSGKVNITLTGDNTLAFKISYCNVSKNILESDFALIVGGKATTKKFTDTGEFIYRISVIAYGKAGTSTNLTKDITVRSDFSVPETIITSLTNNANKSWVVDKSVAGHFGVGPWVGSATPEWWAAAIDEKVACCNCFYTAKYTFTKLANGTYTVQVISPDGVFTKTGSLTAIPGIPATGAEGCYSFGGSTKAMSFSPAVSGIVASASTQIKFVVAGIDGFVGYGSCQNTYEILEINNNYMYLRARGWETGNAWYLKFKPAP
jgi:hypothetical protein